MKKTSPNLFILLFCLAGCTKNFECGNMPLPTSCVITSDGFAVYKIMAGHHFSEGNNHKPIELDTMKFAVRFDSSAIYRTASPQNQYDINKLWGLPIMTNTTTGRVPVLAGGGAMVRCACLHT